MKKLKLLLLTAVMLFTTGCNSISTTSTTSSNTTQTTGSSTPTDWFDNTAATSIDKVAELISEALEDEISAKHDSDGDYLVLNFGETPLDTLKTYTDTYFIPEKFEAEEDTWTADAFQDGTACEYKDYTREDITIEYLVYYYENYGNILQIEAF